MAGRSNEQWIGALSGRSGEVQREALQDLHDFLLRAVLTYLAAQRSELGGWSQSDVRGLAEDLAQDALLEITRSLESFRGESKFTTWAYRFVINRAVSELRRQRYRNVSLDQLREEQGGGLFQAVIADREKIEPELLADQRYYLNLLRDILATELNERQRIALLAVYAQGYTMDEVASTLGMSRNALYKLLHDARRRVKAHLAARDISERDILSTFEE